MMQKTLMKKRNEKCRLVEYLAKQENKRKVRLNSQMHDKYGNSLKNVFNCKIRDIDDLWSNHKNETPMYTLTLKTSEKQFRSEAITPKRLSLIRSGAKTRKGSMHKFKSASSIGGIEYDPRPLNIVTKRMKHYSRYELSYLLNLIVLISLNYILNRRTTRSIEENNKILEANKIVKSIRRASQPVLTHKKFQDSDESESIKTISNNGNG